METRRSLACPSSRPLAHRSCGAPAAAQVFVRWAALVVAPIVASTLALGACNDDDAPPPLVCNTPAPAVPRFVDATAEFGLAPSASLTPIATTLRAADLDGDGYPDLIATMGSGDRAPAAKAQRLVLMNRPDPSDASGRTRRFVDATLESGLLATRDGPAERGWSVANLGDLDNDGDLDAVVCPYASAKSVDPCAAFLNDGAAHFTLAAPSAIERTDGIPCVSMALLDYDRDGRLDLWPAVYGLTPSLFRGAGDGTFTDQAPRAGLAVDDGDPTQHASFRRSFGVTACDVDGDGDEDVLLADYGREANQLWRNDTPPGGAGAFVEVGQSTGVAFDDRIDYRDDESYRCYCATQAGACPSDVPRPRLACSTPCNPSRERCWIPGESDQPWRLGGNTFSIACGDVDDDGDMDLMTAEIRHWDVGSASDPSELLYNDAPRGTLEPFRRPGNDATGLARPGAEKGSWNLGDMMPVFADVDLDGRKDIYLTSSDYPGDHGWLWRQLPDGRFEDITTPSGAGHKQIHGVALVDLDRDGDLDLVAGTSTARGVAPASTLAVYRNDTDPATVNFTQLRLVGAEGRSNRAAIGARVAVTAGGRTQVQEVSGGYGHGSIQNDLVLTFGLGPACTIDRIEVRWPDAAATVDRWESLRANYRIELTQGDRKPRYLR